MANLSPWLTQKFFDANGLPLNGGKLWSYEAGTTTPLATYIDSTGVTPNTNPIILDANGEASIWLGQDAYKFVLMDPDDVELKTWDGVQLIAPGSITTSKIANGAVTADKLASNSVTTDKINNLAVTTAKIANLAVATTKINDGAVTNAKLADDVITPDKLNDTIYSQVFTERNKIINGDMDYWQRGTSFAAVADKTFTADRYAYCKSGAMVHTIAREVTVIPSFAEAGYQFPASMKVTCTTADATMAAGDFCEITQIIEGSFFRDLIKKEFVFSTWVYSSKTGKMCAAFKNGTTTATSPAGKSFVKEFTINTANTWQKITIPVTAPTDGTWNGPFFYGLYASIVLATGATYQTTPDAWQNGNYSGTSTMDNFCDNTSNIFYMTGWRLEGGSIPRQYDSRHPGIESLLCERYCELVTGSFFGYNPNVAVSNCIGGVTPYRTGKAFTPTLAVGTPVTSLRCSTGTATDAGSGVQFVADFTTGSAGSASLVYTALMSAELPI